MQSDPDISEEWLKSPISSVIGTIWLAGHLRNHTAIPRTNMRILGRYALILVHDGEIFYIDETRREAVLGAGHAIIVTPKLAHAYGSNNGNTWSQTYVVFDGPQFDLLQESKNIRKRQPFWKLDSMHSWKKSLEGVLRHLPSTQPDHSIRTLGKFVQLLIEMATSDGLTKTPEEAWLQESIRLLGEPQETGWMSPQQVAIKVGLSYENFRKLFTHRMSNPPARFQLQRKIDRASAAIYQGSKNFKELAEELDFCDVYHFSKVFRQIKGIPPSTYRRTVRGK